MQVSLRSARGILGRVLTCLCLAACLASDRNVELSYRLPSAAEDVRSREAATPLERGSIVLLPVRDQRGFGARVGEVRNGWGMRVADVVTKDSVALWVERALEAELVAAGFDLVRDALPRSGVAALQVRVERLFASPRTPFDAEVVLASKHSYASGGSLRRTYTGRADAGGAHEAPEKRHAEGFARALRNALLELVAELSRNE